MISQDLRAIDEMDCDDVFTYFFPYPRTDAEHQLGMLLKSGWAAKGRQQLFVPTGPRGRVETPFCTVVFFVCHRRQKGLPIVNSHQILSAS